MYIYVDDDSNFYDLALDLSDGNIKRVYADLETSGLDARMNSIILFQIKAGDKIYIYDFLKLNKEHLKYLVNLLKNVTKVESVFHNAKFDLKFLYHNTGMWLDKVFDTMNCEVLINAGVGRSLYSLKELARKYCGVELNKDDREVFYKEEVKVITEQMLIYSAMDVEVLEGIYNSQVELIAQARENKVLQIEMELLPVVAEMEYTGVSLDKDLWLSLEKKEIKREAEFSRLIMEGFLDQFKLEKYPDALSIAKELKIPVHTKKLAAQLQLITVTENIREWVKQNLNLGSHLQLKSALGLIGIKVASIDKKKVLKKLEKNPIIDAMMGKSESSKRVSTYGSNVIELIHPITNKLHTEFFNMGAETGRFSSSTPNLQNIPTVEGYRESFIASPDYDWLSVDYSQQEFRLAGAVTNEKYIIDAYLAGKDMHAATASIVVGKPLNQISKEERSFGKTVNFAILYGTTEWGMKKNLNISIDEAKEIIKKFYDGYPTLYAFKMQAEEMIMKLGFSSTPLGRRKYISPRPLYMNNHEYMRWEAKQKREGFNHIVQGGGVDITKLAMINIWRNNPFGDKLRLLIPVHDEINAEAHKSISRDALEFIKEEMLKAEQPFLKDIPAAVDLKIADHWLH